MYPAESPTRPQRFPQHAAAQWNVDAMPFVVARDARPALAKSTLSSLREFYHALSRAIVIGVSAAVIIVPIVTLLAAANVALAQPLARILSWTQSPLIWLAMILLQI